MKIYNGNRSPAWAGFAWRGRVQGPRQLEDAFTRSLRGFERAVDLAFARMIGPLRDEASSFAYAYDAAGRRTARVDSEATTNVFSYNIRSELTEALMGTNSYGYAYDPIGNRVAATDNGAATAYAVNELNQYTNIAPATGEPAYDLDGNLISDGAWIYSWDAENRMVDVSPATTNIGSVRLSFAHDYMSRRVRKKVEAWDGSMWGNTVTSLYTYDGWNLICEDRSDDNKNNYYVWGLDLSGTPQGAGGVGGLLARVREENIPRPLYYAGDANGNITDLVDTNGAVVAHYEYDPYGNTIAQSGDQADANPFRFSSKYWDGETGFYYYGYRFYSPELGRWISSDPQNEIGALNVIYKDVLADLRQKRSLAEAARIQNANQNPAITPEILAYLNQKYRTEFILPSAVSSEPDVLMVIMAIDPNLYLFVVNNPLFFVDADGRDWWPPSKWPIWPKPKDPGTWPIPGKPTCKKVKICGKEVYVCYWKNPDPDPQPDDPKVCCWISIPW